MHGYAGNFIRVIRHLFARGNLTPDAMFRGKKRGKMHVFSIVEKINSGDKIAVHASGIGDKTYAFAFERVEIPAFKHFKSGFYLRAVGQLGRSATGAQ